MTTYIWCEAYDRGEFPAGERTVGEVVVGRPPLSGDKTATLAVKLPAGMKAAVVQKAQNQGGVLLARMCVASLRVP